MRLILFFNFSLLFINGEIIPRRLLFDNPKYYNLKLSPDGESLAFLAPNEFGISNVFTKCILCKKSRAVTFEMKGHISSYQWTGATGIILYSMDNDGDENSKLYKINITDSSPTTEVHTVSDKPNVKAVILDNNVRDTKILVGLNDENPKFYNVYELNLITNEMRLVFHNSRFQPGMVVDNHRRIRLVTEENGNGDLVYYRPSEVANWERLTSDAANWEKYLTVRREDVKSTSPVAFSKENNRLFWLTSQDADLGQLILTDFDRPQLREIVYNATRTEIVGVIFHPVDRTVLAIVEYYHKPEFYVANSTVLDDIQYLVNLRPNGTPLIESASLDFEKWLVAYVSEAPTEYFLYNRRTKRAQYLFNTRPELASKPLSRIVSFDFKARDGLTLQSYLTLPPSAELLSPEQVHGENVELAQIGLLPVEPQKLILSVHGGPTSRDGFGFDSMNTLFTNRGYAVLQVNFRGSAGFGKKHLNAGNGEWGRKMHYDLLDAVEFAISKGITHRETVAIYGASYGGYSTLIGMTFTPDVFACGVDIVGPSNLITLQESTPPYWAGFYKQMVTMMGADKNTPKGRESLKSRSPFYFAKQVRNPLLIIHGSNDPRVKQSESDQFVRELQKNNIPVTYVVYPDEGHGLRKPPNVLSMIGILEEFLSSCLHGEAEPFHLGEYNSTARMIADARRSGAFHNTESSVEYPKPTRFSRRTL